MTHLESAARAMERALAAEFPEHAWVVSVGEREGRDLGERLAVNHPAPIGRTSREHLSA